ncbi:hypothetical protein MPER_02501, partial [Moniliophthora perniciosa FA553]
ILMPPKVKPPTHAQLQKAAAKKSNLKRTVEHRQRIEEAGVSQPQTPTHDRGTKVTHFTKETGEVFVDYLPPSPTKKRQRLLEEVPNESESEIYGTGGEVLVDDGDPQWEDEAIVGVIGRLSPLDGEKGSKQGKGRRMQ